MDHHKMRACRQRVPYFPMLCGAACVGYVCPLHSSEEYCTTCFLDFEGDSIVKRCRCPRNFTCIAQICGRALVDGKCPFHCSDIACLPSFYRFQQTYVDLFMFFAAPAQPGYTEDDHDIAFIQTKNQFEQCVCVLTNAVKINSTSISDEAAYELLMMVIHRCAKRDDETSVQHIRCILNIHAWRKRKNRNSKYVGGFERLFRHLYRTDHGYTIKKRVLTSKLCIINKDLTGHIMSFF